MFRYHITASGCELAKKLVRANEMVDDADCARKPKQVKNKTEQHVPLASDFRLTDCQPLVTTKCQLPVAAVASGTTAASAVISDEEEDWQKELNVVLPDYNHTGRPRCVVCVSLNSTRI